MFAKGLGLRKPRSNVLLQTLRRSIVSLPEDIATSVFKGKLVKDIARIKSPSIASITVDENETVFNATRLMVERRTGSLCVTRDDNIVGIVTERDYLTKVLHAGRRSEDTPVKDIATMEDKLVIAHPDDSLQDCIDVMAMRCFRHLPVAEANGQVIALLSIKDIAKELALERHEQLSAVESIKTAANMPMHDG